MAQKAAAGTRGRSRITLGPTKTKNIENEMAQARMACEDFLHSIVPSLFLLPYDEEAPVKVSSTALEPTDMFSALFTVKVDRKSIGRFWLGVNPWRSAAVLFFPIVHRWWQPEYLVAAQHIFQLPKVRGWRFRWTTIQVRGKPTVALVIKASRHLPNHFLNRETYRLEIAGTVTDIVHNLLQLHLAKGMPLPIDEKPFLFDGAMDSATAAEEG